MIQIVIKIGTAKALNRTTSWTIIPDDRQTKIEIIDGVHVQDYGVIEEGETISCTVDFTAENWAIVKGYWMNRTLVEVIGENSASLGNRRVVVKSYTRIDRFPDHTNATLEFWAV